MKIRALKALIRRRGYISRPGKGSHSIWTHPTRPNSRLVLHGSDGDDAKPYQIARVRKSSIPQPGEIHIPTFAESLASGEIGPGQRDMLFCYELVIDEITRQVSIRPIRGAIGEQHTQLVVAGSQSGKTTYMASNMAQGAVLGTLFYIIDPHRNHPEKSISAKMAEFKDWCILPPAMTHQEIAQVLTHAIKVRDARIQGKPTPYDGYHIMFVVDEVPALMAYQRSSDKRIRQLYLDLALFMQSLGIQTAKFGMTGLFASQFATKEALGEVDFRDACMSQLIMRLHPTQAQAMRILGPEAVRAIPTFPKGHGFLMLSNATEVLRVASGNVTPQDLAYLASSLSPSPLKAVKASPKAGRNHLENGSMISMRGEVDAPGFDDESGSKGDGNQVRNKIDPAIQAKLDEMGISRDYILRKVDQVTELLGQNKGDIMRAVWFVSPGKGRAYEEAEEEYNLAMAILRHNQIQLRERRNGEQ
jgi:HicA toxin of bacterial toxin-antitoxin,